jgi:uncharacterized membrane protein (DUF4010 family)
MIKTFESIPPEVINFILVTLFSLLLGFEQRRRNIESKPETLFGTDRTFTFIGIFGFILWVIEPDEHYLYMGGGVVVASLLGIYYFQKIAKQNLYGLTTILIALITYCFAPLVITQPRWLTLLIVVTVLFLAELKETFLEVSKKFDKDEFITLGKFIIIAGIILPIVPDEQVFSFINVSPYKVWLAVVIISAISYFSYLLNKFVFTNSGILVTGILGGLYSSTATSIILAKKSKESKATPHEYASAIIFATSMMYLRIFIIFLIFSKTIAILILPYFAAMIVINLGIGYFIYSRKTKDKKDTTITEDAHRNPLEFKVALVFALIYVVFTYITQFTITYYGSGGLTVLSYISGLSDIDPFLLNLVQNKYEITSIAIAFAASQAIISNNILKAAYTYTLSDKPVKKLLLIGFSILTIAGVGGLLLIR